MEGNGDSVPWMITLRPSSSRGYANHGWLDSWHSFSFGEYHDPQWMGFRSLRVINDDHVAPGTARMGMRALSRLACGPFIPQQSECD